MVKFLEDLLKQFPGDAGERALGYAETHCSNHMVLFEANHVFSSTASFNCFEFVVPLTSFPPARIENKKLLPEYRQAFPVNPGQKHDALVKTPDAHRYYSIFIDRHFLQEISRAVFNSPADIYFKNMNHKISPNLLNLLRLFADESRHRQPGYQLLNDSITSLVAVNLLRELTSNLSIKPAPREYKDANKMRMAADFLAEHYRDDFSLEEIARLVNYSPYHFIKIFKNETGKTPFEYLVDIKINKARELLKQRHLAIAEVCYLSGFNNLSHFATTFKRKTGLSPTEYRKTCLWGTR